MCSDLEPQDRSIAEKCELLIELIRGITPPPPNHLWLLNRLSEIKLSSQRDAHAARSEFEEMMRDLWERSDGVGSFILTGDRYKKYFDTKIG